MYLYFEHSDGSLSFVCECSEEEVGSRITEYVHKLNPGYKIYYTRAWRDDDGGIKYDVGSHTEFFLAYDAPLSMFAET